MSDPKQRIQVFALRQPFVAFEGRAWRPSHNMYETERGVVLVVELAGVSPDQLHIHLHPQQVVVHGVRQLAAPGDIRRVERMEIGAGPFELEVPLTRPIDPDGVQARYNAGLLEIGLPYAQQPTRRVVVVRLEGGER